MLLVPGRNQRLPTRGIYQRCRLQSGQHESFFYRWACYKNKQGLCLCTLRSLACMHVAIMRPESILKKGSDAWAIRLLCAEHAWLMRLMRKMPRPWARPHGFIIHVSPAAANAHHVHS